MTNYEELNIYELRQIARNIGVYSPTTLKRKDLIDKIEKIKNGELNPYIRKSKQGRPAKNLTNLTVDVNNLTTEKKKEIISCTDNFNNVKRVIENIRNLSFDCYNLFNSFLEENKDILK